MSQNFNSFRSSLILTKVLLVFQQKAFGVLLHFPFEMWSSEQDITNHTNYLNYIGVTFVSFFIYLDFERFKRKTKR